MRWLPIVICAGLLCAAAYGAEWKAASQEDRGVEVRLGQPARNSCEVSFRDLLLRKKTAFTATIQYLPHRAAKGRVELETVNMVVGVGADSEHVSGCEQVVGVMVSGIRRE